MESKVKQEADRIVFEYQFSDSSLPFNDGIIKALEQVNRFYERNDLINSDIMPQPIAHWQEVKQELNKML